MRVITGTARGRKLAALEGVVNRSTAGTVWQTLREQGNWSWTP